MYIYVCVYVVRSCEDRIEILELLENNVIFKLLLLILMNQGKTYFFCFLYRIHDLQTMVPSEFDVRVSQPPR